MKKDFQAIGDLPGINRERLETIQERIKKGFYDQAPQVQEALKKGLLADLNKCFWEKTEWSHKIPINPHLYIPRRVVLR